MSLPELTLNPSLKKREGLFADRNESYLKTGGPSPVYQHQNKIDPAAIGIDGIDIGAAILFQR